MDNTAQITRASLVNMDETALSGRDLADKKGTDDFLPGMYVVETILEKLGVLAEVSVICLSFDLLNVVISFFVTPLIVDIFSGFVAIAVDKEAITPSVFVDNVLNGFFVVV